MTTTHLTLITVAACTSCGTTVDHDDPDTVVGFVSAEDARAALPDWQIDADGTPVCPDCVSVGDCDRDGHSWGPPSTDPGWDDQWRKCRRCYAYQRTTGDPETVEQFGEAA